MRKLIFPLQFSGHQINVEFLGTYHVLTSVTELGAGFPLGKSFRLRIKLSVRPSPSYTHRDHKGAFYYTYTTHFRKNYSEWTTSNVILCDVVPHVILQWSFRTALRNKVRI